MNAYVAFHVAHDGLQLLSSRLRDALYAAVQDKDKNVIVENLSDIWHEARQVHRQLTDAVRPAPQAAVKRTLQLLKDAAKELQGVQLVGGDSICGLPHRIKQRIAATELAMQKPSKAKVLAKAG